MRGKSHQCLGRYLVQHYMADVSPAYQKAFLIGCIEPDRNPTTYLKGSIRDQWLRGHNYLNARRYMRRISQYLERREKLRLLDYYTLGKLIHYTTDAFTYAHNSSFPTDLSDHCKYEAELQEHFLEYMEQDPQVNIQHAKTIMGAIYRYHRDYERKPSDIQRDSRYALAACCCVLAVLFVKPI